MDTSVVATLMTSIVIAFSGVIFAIRGQANKQWLEQMRQQIEIENNRHTARIDGNSQRIGILEANYAAMKAEIHSVAGDAAETKENVREIRRILEDHRAEDRRAP